MTAVVRWRRYGHDRLYVTGRDGDRLGYFDLRTGLAHEVPEAGRAEFDAAVARFHGVHSAGNVAAQEPVAAGPTQVPGQPGGTTTPEARLHPASADRPAFEGWEDLALNRAGQAAAAMAHARRRAAPVRSALGRLLGAHTAERAWRIGAAGEVLTAQALRPLLRPRWDQLRGRPPRWFVLHAIPVGDNDTDIDHVLIGPAGVFTINSKHHPNGRVWVGDHVIAVNGTRTDYARKALAEATRAQRLLTAAHGAPVPVQPIVAVLGASLTGNRTTCNGVLVTRAGRLPRLLKRATPILTDHQVHAIHATARRSTTWRTLRPTPSVISTVTGTETTNARAPSYLPDDAPTG